MLCKFLMDGTNQININIKKIAANKVVNMLSNLKQKERKEAIIQIRNAQKIKTTQMINT